MPACLAPFLPTLYLPACLQTLQLSKQQFTQLQAGDELFPFLPKVDTSIIALTFGKSAKGDAAPDSTFWDLLLSQPPMLCPRGLLPHVLTLLGFRSRELI